MGKKFNQWLDEFVEQGANPKDVTNWPEEAGGSTVVANPPLVGDEPDLTGLEVDGAKYKVPQGGGSLYTYYVKTENSEGLYTFTFQCDNPELDSYNKLAQYLLSKGYYEHTDEGSNLRDATPILEVALDRTSSGNIITGLFASQDETLWIGGRELYISSGQLYTGVVWLKSENFTITLITE